MCSHEVQYIWFKLVTKQNSMTKVHIETKIHLFESETLKQKLCFYHVKWMMKSVYRAVDLLKLFWPLPTELSHVLTPQMWLSLMNCGLPPLYFQVVQRESGPPNTMTGHLKQFLKFFSKILVITNVFKDTVIIMKTVLKQNLQHSIYKVSKWEYVEYIIYCCL